MLSDLQSEITCRKWCAHFDADAQAYDPGVLGRDGRREEMKEPQRKIETAVAKKKETTAVEAIFDRGKILIPIVVTSAAPGSGRWGWHFRHVAQ